MEFMLYQYDLAAKLWHAVPDEDVERESHLASRRRALKHLSEQIAMRSPPECAPVHSRNLFPEVEEAILCAEILVALSTASDQTYFLFPEHTQLSVMSGGYLVPFHLELIPPYSSTGIDFAKRMAKDREYRRKFIPDPTADRDPKFQSVVLDKAFSAEFGFSYLDFLHALVRILTDIAPASGSYPIVFCHRDNVIRELSSCAKISTATATQILAGFTLRANDMKSEGRKLWNTKQIFRAYRRGLFELPHSTGPHLIWSNRMADESLTWLVEGFSFKKVPAEWNTQKIKQGLEALSLAASNWFEQLTVRQLAEMGINGSRRKGRIRGKEGQIEIPDTVGEIDFLGTAKDGSLVIVECKMVESRMEARFWKEDIAEFVGAKKSYSEKFKIKLNWVVENKKQIRELLTGTGEPCEVRAILVTLYPAFASIQISDFPCVSLSEFIADFESAGGWPYETGVFKTE
ncbi:MAG TPA: hypothetical protein VN048_04055 [Verrucomicrobiae bacterium]|nr:hypothetical protein [Verrucomicrobiae bacterium]